MIQVSILKNGTLSNQASFPTLTEAETWLAYHEGLGTFGQKAQTIEQIVEVSPAVIESQEILDENGLSFDPPQFQDVEIVPAQFETQVIQIEGYTVEIEDLTQQIQQDAINQSALKLLADTDWMVIRSITELDQPVPQEILIARAEARSKIVK